MKGFEILKKMDKDMVSIWMMDVILQYSESVLSEAISKRRHNVFSFINNNIKFGESPFNDVYYALRENIEIKPCFNNEVLLGVYKLYNAEYNSSDSLPKLKVSVIPEHVLGIMDRGININPLTAKLFNDKGNFNYKYFE